MATVTIDGVERAARALTPSELVRWNAYISKAAAAMHWVDLYGAVETMPARLQEVAFANNPPPSTVGRLAYFRAASRIESVQVLADMVLDDPAVTVVTEENAEEIFWALSPMVLDEPVVLSGEEALAKLRKVTDAGST